MVLVQVQWLGIGTKYGVEILKRAMAKELKLKVEMFFGASSYVCRSYKGTTRREEASFIPLATILNRVKDDLVEYKCFCYSNNCQKKVWWKIREVIC